MKKLGLATSKNLKIIAATSMAIFSLLTTFTATFAWFISRKNVSDDVDGFPTTVIPGRFLQVSFHTLNSKTITEEEEDITFKFNQTAVGTITYNWETDKPVKTGDTSISLNKYNMLDEHQPVLLLFQMGSEIDTSVNSPVYIKANVNSEMTTHYLGERSSVDNTPVCKLGDSDFVIETVDGKDYYGLSSVVQFYTQDFSTAAYSTWTTGKTTYDFTVGDMDKPVNNFVSIGNALDTSEFHPNIEVYNSGSGPKVEYIAVIVDYFPDSIEYIYSTYLGNETIETYDYDLFFLCDWIMEVV